MALKHSTSLILLIALAGYISSAQAGAVMATTKFVYNNFNCSGSPYAISGLVQGPANNYGFGTCANADSSEYSQILQCNPEELIATYYRGQDCAGDVYWRQMFVPNQCFSNGDGTSYYYGCYGFDSEPVSEPEYFGTRNYADGTPGPASDVCSTFNGCPENAIVLNTYNNSETCDAEDATPAESKLLSPNAGACINYPSYNVIHDCIHNVSLSYYTSREQRFTHNCTGIPYVVNEYFWDNNACFHSATNQSELRYCTPNIILGGSAPPTPTSDAAETALTYMTMLASLLVASLL